MTNSDRNSTNDVRLPSNVCIELSDFFFVDLVELRLHMTLSVNDVLLKQLLVNLEVGIGLLDIAFIK